MRMNFGKYNGMKVQDVPLSYLEWFVTQPDYDKGKNPELIEEIDERVHQLDYRYQLRREAKTGFLNGDSRFSYFVQLLKDDVEINFLGFLSYDSLVAWINEHYEKKNHLGQEWEDGYYLKKDYRVKIYFNQDLLIDTLVKYTKKSSLLNAVIKGHKKAQKDAD